MKNVLNVVFLCTQPKAIQDASPIPHHEEWFRTALANRLNVIQFKTIHVADEPIPTLDQADGVIIGGSSHSVTEELPWMQKLEKVVQSLYQKQIPLLGICFGHQIIAKTLGGTVQEGKNGIELGAHTITLSQDGLKDSLFENVSRTFASGMYHEDVVVEPPKKPTPIELASNDRYHHQALAYGDHVRTVQFHPEFTCPLLTGLIEHRREKLLKKHGSHINLDQMIYTLEQNDVSKSGKQILENFIDYFVQPYHDHLQS